MLHATESKVYLVDGDSLQDVSDDKALFKQGITRAVEGVTCFFGEEGSGRTQSLADQLRFICKYHEDKVMPIATLIYRGSAAATFVAQTYHSLPVDKRHLVGHWVLTNSHDRAINIFDTKVGFKRPLSLHRYHLLTFLSKMLMPTEDEIGGKHISGIQTFLSNLVDRVYDLTQPDDAPIKKMYVRGYYADLDAVVADYDLLTANAMLTASDLAFALHSLGLEEEGIERERLWLARDQAHKQAMPVLKDLFTVLDMWGADRIYTAKLPSGQSLPEHFRSKLKTAIATYPCFAYPTKLDISGSKVTALNLEHVLWQNTEVGKVLFMIAAHKIAVDKMGKDSLEANLDLIELHPLYANYHSEQEKELLASKRLLALDDLNFSDHAEILTQTARHRRKLGFSYILSTKKISDLELVNKHNRLLGHVGIMRFFSSIDSDQQSIFSRYFHSNDDLMMDLIMIDADTYMTVALIEGVNGESLVKASRCKREPLLVTIQRMLTKPRPQSDK